MHAVVPPFYVRPDVPARATVWQRFLAGAMAIAALGVLVMAIRLAPSPSGMGTHTDLGLQECAFLDRTGLPCPSCGMTTSFAYFVRGNWLASGYVQPMGLALALIVGISVWICGYIAISGRPAHRLLRAVPGLLVVLPMLGLAITGWAWKIFIHIREMDGW
jgi:hypothetical protein